MQSALLDIIAPLKLDLRLCARLVNIKMLRVKSTARHAQLDITLSLVSTSVIFAQQVISALSYPMFQVFQGSVKWELIPRQGLLSALFARADSFANSKSRPQTPPTNFALPVSIAIMTWSMMVNLHKCLVPQGLTNQIEERLMPPIVSPAPKVPFALAAVSSLVLVLPAPTVLQGRSPINNISA